MKKQIIFSTFLLVTITFLFTSCSREGNTPTEVKKNTAPSVTSGNNTYYTYDEIINLYMQPNLIGVIKLHSTNYTDVTFQEVSQGVWVPSPFNGVNNNVDATFRNENGNPITVGPIELNASALREYNPGAYTRMGTDNLDLFFGSGTNKIEFEDNTHFSGFNTSFQFASPVSIINIQRFDNVSKQNDFHINWTGGSSQGKVEVSMRLSNPAQPNVTPQSRTALKFYIDNSGSLSIPHQLLQTLSINALYDVTVTAYEPHYITVGNKQILVVGTTSHEVTIQLTN